MMPKTIIRRTQTALLGIAIISCGNPTASKPLGDVDLTGAAADLNSLLEQTQKSPAFLTNVAKAGSSKVGGFATALTKGLSDDSFSFNGKTFGKLKTSLNTNAKTLAAFESIGKPFKSMNDLFAAHGLKGSIKVDEMKAYVKVASAALTALSQPKAAVPRLDTATMARALRVAVALSIVAPEKSSAGLNLVDNPTWGYARPCGTFNNDATYNKNWMCFQKEIGGSIGYLSAGNKKQWEDAFDPSKKFKICDAASAPKGSGAWGWIADPSAPGGGESCHVDIPVTDPSLQEVCAEFKDVDSGDCKPTTSQQAGKTPAAKPSNSKTPKNTDAEAES